METILLTPPEQREEAARFGLPLGHMAFQLGADGRLHQSGLSAEVRGGLLLTGAAEAPTGNADFRPAVQDILATCRNRSFHGVILDLEQPPSPFLAGVIRGVEEGLSRQGKALYLPEVYANFSRTARLYLSSALSGGSLEKRLAQAAERYGAGRLTLCLERVRADFFLPAPKGIGKPLSREALETLMERLEPSVFFSKDLCAHYFTYVSRSTGAHFVLFDDGESLRKKMEAAEKAGISRCFLLYPETAEFLPALLST